MPSRSRSPFALLQSPLLALGRLREEALHDERVQSAFYCATVMRLAEHIARLDGVELGRIQRGHPTVGAARREDRPSQDVAVDVDARHAHDLHGVCVSALT